MGLILSPAPLTCSSMTGASRSELTAFQRRDDPLVSQRGLSGMVQGGVERHEVIQKKVHHGVVGGKEYAIASERREAQVKPDMFFMGRDTGLDLLIGLLD